MKVFSYNGVSFLNGYPKITGADTISPFQLKTLNEKHIQITQKLPEVLPKEEQLVSNFATALNNMLNDVEKLSNQSDNLTRKIVYDPDSVDVHEVMIAAQKARFALNLTKTIADGLVRAYRELTTPR